MNEQDILIPKKENIKIANRKYKLGAITLKQAILFGQFMVKNIISKREKFKEFTEKTKDSDSNEQDILTMLEVINPQDSYKLFSILLNENDLKFLEDNLGLDTSIEIIAILCEYNNFEKVKKNFQRIIKVLNPKK